MGGRELRSLLQFSERWPCHIWLVGRMLFSALEANLGLGQGLLVYPILIFLPLSWRSPGMTEILLIGTLNLNQSINQYNKNYNILNPTYFSISGKLFYILYLTTFWTNIGRTIFCLFDLILYVPSTIFQIYRDGSSWVEPVLS